MRDFQLLALLFGMCALAMLGLLLLHVRMGQSWGSDAAVAAFCVGAAIVNLFAAKRSRS
jgi:hypothetical protein